MNISPDSKQCRRCLQNKSFDQFSITKSSPDGRCYWCKQCQNERHRELYRVNREAHIAKSSARNKANPERVALNMKMCRERDPEHFSEYARKWKKDHPEETYIFDVNKKSRRRLVGSAICEYITLDEWKSLKLNHKNRCHYCGKDTEFLTIDHVVPLSKGGDHSLLNIVPACKSCNCSKQDMDVIDFMKTRLST